MYKIQVNHEKNSYKTQYKKNKVHSLRDTKWEIMTAKINLRNSRI